MYLIKKLLIFKSHWYAYHFVVPNKLILDIYIFWKITTNNGNLGPMKRNLKYLPGNIQDLRHFYHLLLNTSYAKKNLFIVYVYCV